MINHPIAFFRDFRNDFPSLQLSPEEWKQFQRITFATMPLLTTLHPPFRKPLSLGMSTIRCTTHFSQLITNAQKGEKTKTALSFFHTGLSVASVGLFFFNPTLCLITSSIDDFITHFSQFVKEVKEGEVQKSLEAISLLSLDLLFIASCSYGSIELTVACFIEQTLLSCYESIKHLKKGNYLEGLCQMVLIRSHLKQAVPQLKVLKWKWDKNPTMQATLKQAPNGFTYLDISDEYVKGLFITLANEKGELPPYFGPKMAGAHVSAISGDEIPKNFKIEDLGKTFTFRIVHSDAVRPDGWKGVDRVYFLTLSCPELEEMRARHGLSPTINGHDFHMTYGIQKSST